MSLVLLKAGAWWILPITATKSRTCSFRWENSIIAPDHDTGWYRGDRLAGQVVCPGPIDLHAFSRTRPNGQGRHHHRRGRSGHRRVHHGRLHAKHHPLDRQPATVKPIQERAAEAAPVNVYVTGTITLGIAGEEPPIGPPKMPAWWPSPMTQAAKQRTDARPRICRYVRSAGHGSLPGLFYRNRRRHARGYWSTNLGLWPAGGWRGRIVARNIELAELTGTHIHCQHISSGKSVELIRQAKARGVPILARPVSTITLTDATIGGMNIWAEDAANHKPSPAHGMACVRYVLQMNPPLRWLIIAPRSSKGSPMAH